jgi:hypothetical protein
MNLNRRSFFIGAAAGLLASSVVSASSLMSLRPGFSGHWLRQQIFLKEKDGDVWRTIDRIDCSGLEGAEPPDVFAMMARSVIKLPPQKLRIAPERWGLDVVKMIKFETTLEVRQHMEMQAIRSRNVLVRTIGDNTPVPCAFRGIAIES